MNRIALIIVALVGTLALTGCLSTSSTASGSDVTRMELWIHNVEGTNPVFEVTAESTAPASSIGNGTLEAADMQQIINSVMSIYSTMSEADRAALLSNIIKVVGLVAAAK